MISGKIAMFCFSSAGELDVMLPVLRIHGVTDFKVVTFKREIVKRIDSDGLYRRLLVGRLDDRTVGRVSGNKVLRWLQFVSNSIAAFRAYRKYDAFCFEYGLSGREKNVLIALLVLTGRGARILYYPHGHAIAAPDAYDEHNWPAITRYSARHGSKILKLGAKAADPRLLTIDYPILHTEWREFVMANVPRLYSDHVVILSRDAHPFYLSEANRLQMFDDVFALFRQYFPESRIVIKAHPREVLAAQDLQSGGQQVEVTYENTYSVVNGARLVVSFWTSAFFQCLALGVPVVEYHLPHDKFRSLFPGGSPHRAFIPAFEHKSELARYMEALQGSAVAS